MAVWHIEEISEEAQASAVNAAQEENLSLGTWLTQVINEELGKKSVPAPILEEKLTSIERAMLKKRNRNFSR